MPVDRYPLGLIVRVAGAAAAISAVFGIWLAWILLNRQFPGKRVLSAIAMAALILPSPVICYYLLSVLGHAWPLTRAGLIAAGVLSAAPMIVRASGICLGSVEPVYAKAARSMGVSDWRVFVRVELPLAYRGLLAAVALAFTRVAAEMAVAFWLVDPRP